MTWYEIKNIHEIDSPSLAIYWERCNANIQKVIEVAGGVERLRPHVKTHKLGEIIQLHIQYGFTKFKAATIAEAEMIAMNGGQDVLIAHQLTPPKILRYVRLLQKYPQVKWSALVDNAASLRALATACENGQVTTHIYLDIDNGLTRSGIKVGQTAAQLYELIDTLPNVQQGGLHVYDGHLRHSDFDQLRALVNRDFESVQAFIEDLKTSGHSIPEVVVAGSPTFPAHALRANVTLSPGTYIFWDQGYAQKAPYAPFKPAALVLTRIISKMADDLACLDLGHKSIASENPHPRVYFLNCNVDKFLIHSEEHLVIQSPDLVGKKVGDVLYGVPHHICPTVNLQQEVTVIREGIATETWEVIGRRRKITV